MDGENNGKTLLKWMIWGYHFFWEKNTYCSAGGGFKYFWEFSPQIIGEMIQFDEHIFQMR